MKHQNYLSITFSLLLFICCADSSKKNDANKAVKNSHTEAASERGHSATEESPKTLQVMKHGYNQGYQKGYADGYTAGLVDNAVRFSTDTANIKIAIVDIKKLVAEIIYLHDGSAAPPQFPNQVISKKFEAYSILNTEEPAALAKYVGVKIKNKFILSENEFYNYFIVEDTIRLTETGEMLAVMRDCNGFEFIPYVFAIFEITGDQLMLRGLLDALYGAGIGKLWIEKMIKISSDDYVLQGRTGGGDAGDHWGSLWLGYWKRPLHLKKLYEKSCYFKSETYEYPSETNEKMIDCKINNADLWAEVILRERKVRHSATQQREYSEWFVVERDRIDFLQRIKNLENSGNY